MTLIQSKCRRVDSALTANAIPSYIVGISPLRAKRFSLRRFFFWGALVVPFMLTAQTGSAQKFPATFLANGPDQPKYASAANIFISAHADMNTGQFWFEGPGDKPLLFFREGGATSFTNVRFQNTTFTSNDLRSPQSPPFTQRLPKPSVQALSDRVRCTWQITRFQRTLEVVQDFVPSLDGSFAFVRVITTLRNTSTVPVDAGMQLMFDLYLDGVDGIDLLVDGTTISRERGWTGNEVPNGWEGSAPNFGLTVLGKLDGAERTRPDRFVAGNWQFNGYLGAAYWNYIPSPRRLIDNAVLMQWDERPLQPGESVSYVTDYGYNVIIGSDLQCSADQIVIGADSTSYVPNPFQVRAVFTNQSSFPLDSVGFTITVPPSGVRLVGTVPSSVLLPASLQPGAQVTVTWLFLADTAFTPTPLTFVISVQTPYFERRCSPGTTVPALKKIAAELICGDTIRLSLTPDGFQYEQNPFPVAVSLKNTGSRDVSLGYGIIGLPSQLWLLLNDSFKLPTPSVILPGQSGVYAWEVYAAPQQRDTVVAMTFVIRTVAGLIYTCTRYVFLPAVQEQGPCVDNGASTTGTSFHATIPVNNSGGLYEPALYIAARQQAAVRIEQRYLGFVEDIVVPAGDVGRYALNSLINSHHFEEIDDQSVIITSDVPVSVTIGSLATNHSDASIVLPDHALGLRYVVCAYNYSTRGPNESFVVVASADSTVVTIIPYSTTDSGRPPGVPFSFLLNTGETYCVATSTGGALGGMTGSKVDASKPVAVFAGGFSGYVPDGETAFLNPLFDQMIPEHLLGKEYVALPFLTRLRGDTYRAVAAFDNTTLTITGRAPVSLPQRGEFYEFQLEEATVVSADLPFLLCQFANSASWDAFGNEHGDASLVALSPTDRFITCHNFPTGLQTRFDSAYVNIVVTQGVENAVTVDGLPLADSAFHRVGASQYLYARLPLQPYIHTVSVGDARGAGCIVYSFDYHDALTYNSGFLVTPIKPLLEADAGRESVTDFSLSVAPNPARNTATLTLTSATSGSVEVALVDALGRTLRSFGRRDLRRGANAMEISVSGLPSGLYQVVVVREGALHSKMLHVVK